MKSVWSRAEDERLEALWNAGEKCSEIARILSKEFRRDINKNKVVGRKSRLKLGDRPSPIKHLLDQDIKAEARALLATGRNIVSVAALTGMSTHTASKIKSSIPMERPVFYPEPLPRPAPKPVFTRPALSKTVTTFKYIPHSRCLSPDGCSDVIAPHSPYSYCVKHRRMYYSYDPMTDRNREVNVRVPWTGHGNRGGGGKIEAVEELEKV